MPLTRSDNKTHEGLTQDDFDAYRNRSEGEKGHYKKVWQTSLDMDALERKHFRESPEYIGSELEKEDKARQERKDKIMATFKRYDKNGDFILNKREFGAIFVDCGWPRDKAEALYKVIDKNPRDGGISPQEFINWCFKEADDYADVRKHCQRAIKPAEALKEFFEHIRLLKDAKTEETIARREAIFGDNDIDFDALWNIMDANGNGDVSMQEFTTALKTMKYNVDQKMMEKIYGLLDTAQTNSKGLVDAEGNLLQMKDGKMEMEEWKNAWEAAMG